MVKLPMKLGKCFPKTTTNYLALAGTQAYEMAYSFLEDGGLTLTERGKGLATHIVNAYYDLNVRQLANKGEIPYRFEERENKRLNCYHGLLIGDSCKWSISHVSRVGQCPRKADFRGEYASNNPEISLFEEDEEKLDDTMAYAILTHMGYGTFMQHARIGFPQKGQKKWAGHQLTIFDRLAIIETKVDEAKQVPIQKPKLKELKERLGDVLK